jgi:hypothetical protein
LSYEDIVKFWFLPIKLEESLALRVAPEGDTGGDETLAATSPNPLFPSPRRCRRETPGKPARLPRKAAAGIIPVLLVSLVGGTPVTEILELQIPV